MVDGLFGPQPAERVRGRGRPAHVWTRQNSLRICNLFACGRTVEEVAAVIGVSQPTLRKVYFSELAARDVMFLKVRSEQMARLTEAAIGGSVAAEKALAGLIQAERLAVQAHAVTRRGDDKAKAAPIGKKQAALDVASQQTGKFGARTPPPRLIQ